MPVAARQVSPPLILAIAVCALVGAAVAVPRTQPNNNWCCNCSTSADCPSGWYCQWVWCFENPSDATDDDICFFGNGLFSNADLPDAGQALDLWLQAYETAGGSGGGPPDAALVGAAQAVSLTPLQHDVVRIVAFQVQALYLGTSNDEDPPLTPGFWTPPAPPPNQTSFFDLLPNDHGSVASLNASQLGAGSLVRQAVVGELMNPGQGVLEANLAQIPIQFPGYAPVGRCEFPQGPPFPYASSQDCLTQELRAMVDSLLAPVSAVPTMPRLGLAILTLTLLTAGAVVSRRRRLSRA